MNGKINLLVIALLAVPLLQACETSAAWEGTITDSAGVAIVSNTSTPLWSGDEAWTAEEDLRIGTVAGEPEYQFGQLAFLDVSHDGRIFVTDAQAQEVRGTRSRGSICDGDAGWRNGGPGPGKYQSQPLRG